MIRGMGVSMVSLPSNSVTDSVTADMGVFEISFGRRPLGLRERDAVVEGVTLDVGLDVVVSEGGRERAVEEERER